MVKALVLVAYMLLLLLPARAQQAAQPVQFSGITVTEDSLGILPYVTILVKNRYKGTISDARGFFSFVALPGDTIQFSAIGYRNNYYLMPEAERDLHSVIMPLEKDTIELPMAVIYPWPSKEAFREAFLALQLDDDMYDIARKNLEGQLLAEISQKNDHGRQRKPKAVYAKNDCTNLLCRWSAKLPPNGWSGWHSHSFYFVKPICLG